ncbi:MAG: hypothetical protein WA733_20970 [Methylocystis sp.]
MTEIRTVTTLRRKRDEITAVIKLYERQLAQARADLAHVNAAMRVFEAEGTRDFQAYIDVHRVFSYREKWPLCEAALREHGPMTTKELALHLMAAKGLDTDDNVLARTIANRLIHSLRMQAMRGRVLMDGKRKGVCVWAINDDSTKV